MDGILLFPPGASALASAWASTIQLGSWLDPEVGVDYGSKDLIQSMQAGNALTDGGRFGYRHGTIRKMQIPLIINTPSPAMWEGMLARAAYPGAIIAVQPELVPSSQAVYFAVIDGRYEPAHNIFHNRVGVRKGVLHLETQPYGYWPTEILLASSASVGQFGTLAVNGASLLGDVPPIAHVRITPTTASAYMPTGSWFADMAAWSLSGRPSFSAVFPASAFSFVASVPPWNPAWAPSQAFLPTIAADVYAPGGQGWGVQMPVTPPGSSAWTQLYSSLASAIPSALAPAYAGRFRVFAFAKMTPSCLPWQLIVDAQRFQAGQALASANQIATWAQPAWATSLYMVATGLTGGFTPASVTGWATSFIASPGYQILDCGELTLPPYASGFQGPVELRVWANPIPAISASNYAWFGGLYLLPVDGPAGILTGGLAAPSVGAWQATTAIVSSVIDPSHVFYVVGASPASMAQGQFEMNMGFSESYLVTRPGASQVYGDVRALHRGVTPRIGASTNQLNILLGDRRAGESFPTMAANLEFAAVSVSYRPEFQFLYGV